MSKYRKTIPGWFLAWNYDNEEESLNKQSKKGWRLKRAYLFHKVYEKNENEYRYRVDYKPSFNLTETEKERYFGTFEDMGWRHVNSIFNGWHYFEKPVLADSEEDDFAIYTDNASLMDMLGRWIYVGRVLEIICAVIALINFFAAFHGSTPNLFCAITALIEVILFEFGIRSMKKKRVGVKKSSRLNVIMGNILFFAMLAVLIIGQVGFYHLVNNKPLVNTKYNSSYTENTKMNDLSFLVEKDGKYHLEAFCQLEQGEVAFEIYDAGQLIYRAVGCKLEIDEKINLKEGIHRVHIEPLGDDELEDENYVYVDVVINKSSIFNLY